MDEDRRARRVGAVVLGLIAAAALAVLTVDCDALRPAIDVTVYYGHAGALGEGAEVHIAGRVVGQVDAVRLVPAADASSPDHPLHPGGGVAVRLRMQARYAGWAGPESAFIISSRGILGEATIEVGPPDDGTIPVRGLRDGDAVRGIDPARMDLVLVKSFENMTKFRILLDDIAPAAAELRAALAALGQTLDAAEPHPGAYRSLSDGLGRVGDEWDELTARFSSGDPVETIARAGAVIDRTRVELARVSAALDLLGADVDRIRSRIPPDLLARLTGAIATARASVTQLQTIAATAADLAARVRRGEGTVGALMNDPEFSDDAKQLGKILKRQPWRVLGHPRREALEKQGQE